jgi:hypothetical protein
LALLTAAFAEARFASRVPWLTAWVPDEDEVEDVVVASEPAVVLACDCGCELPPLCAVAVLVLFVVVVGEEERLVVDGVSVRPAGWERDVGCPVVGAGCVAASAELGP